MSLFSVSSALVPTIERILSDSCLHSCRGKPRRIVIDVLEIENYGGVGLQLPVRRRHNQAPSVPALRGIAIQWLQNKRGKGS